MKARLTVLALLMILSCSALCAAGTNAFPTWKTVKVGTSTDKFSLWNDLKALGCDRDWSLGEYEVTNVISNPNFKISAPASIQLAKVSVRDLCGDMLVTTVKGVCDRAKSKGLELCPSEAAIQLMIQYGTELKPVRGKFTEWFYIGMQPIVSNSANVFSGYDIFYVGYPDRGPSLSTVSGHPSFLCSGDEVWIFMKAK